MDISTLDKNYSTQTVIKEKNCVFFNPKNQPFEIFGLLFSQNGCGFMRMPQSIADSVNPCVSYFNKDTSGGRIRFSTDSKYVAIRVKMPYILYPHQSLLGSCGFDLYVDGKRGSEYYKSFIPPKNFENGFENIVYFNSKKKRDITIYFPLYSHVDEIGIGLDKNSTVDKAKEYSIKKPIVFYGSSVTQGGCASKPSNSSASMIARTFNADFLNLGFSSGAKGEKIMAEYISSLDMSALIIEYDHNAPSVEYLKDTHYEFVKTIRDKNKNLPIIIVSKHDFTNCAYYVKKQSDNVKRRQVVLDTYNKFLSDGDKNIYFVDGKKVLGKDNPLSCTVDGCHLNDLGFYKLSESYKKILRKIFNK